MRPADLNTSFKTFLYSILCFMLIFSLAGCGEDKQTAGNTSDTGSIEFSVVWNDPTEDDTMERTSIRALSGDVCIDYLIETINAAVYNSSDTIVATESWPCSDHGGTISGVSTGSGMRVVIEGIVAGNVHWSGEATGITVSAGQTYNAGTITVNYFGPDQIPPGVDLKNPDVGATDVPLNSVITATFSEAVIPASVNSSTFTLTKSGGSVSGQVTYNPGTFTATFTPTGDLSPTTSHTATITTDVEDLAGIQMALPVSWSFTTGTVINPPTVTTGSATSVTSSSATLNGTINPNGDSTTYYFEYGTTLSYGSTTASTSAGSGTIAVSVSTGISGLSPSTDYHFRIRATNSGGTSIGSDQPFTTGPTGNDTLIWDEGNWDEKNWE